MAMPDAAVRSLPAIEAIDVFEVLVPRPEAARLTSAYGQIPDAHHALVTISAGGFTGVGEATTDAAWNGDDGSTARHAIVRYLAPAIAETRGIREAIQAMNHALAGHPSAKLAVETALWDLLAKCAGLPLHVLLGGGGASPVPSKFVIGRAEPGEARKRVEAGRELGFRNFKVKVGGDLDEDLARVAAITECLREDEWLGVDANGGWTPVTALAALEPLQRLGVSFVEQPVTHALPEAMAAITARSAIPVVAHESVFTLRDAAEAARMRIGHVWALTPNVNGSVLATLELVSIARAAGVPCLLSGGEELGIGTALLLQLGAAADEFRTCPVPNDVIGPLFLDDDVTTARWEFSDGALVPPDGPGLGVDLDLERVGAYRVAGSGGSLVRV